MLHDSNTTAPEALIKSLHDGERLMADSDGSFHPKLKLGTSAWVLKKEGSPVLLQGHDIAPDSADSQCSHCSELSGMIGVVRQLNEICSQQDITT